MHDGSPRGDLPTLVIGVVSQKGGVGKTTSAVNLAAAMALSGDDVLLIGTDPQCGVSSSLGFGPGDLHCGLDTMFRGPIPLPDATHATSLENLSILVPDVWTLNDEQHYCDAMANRPETFARIVDEARRRHDAVLIDCPPGLGPVTLAALSACDRYLVPVQAEELCRISLDRLVAGVADLADRDGRAPELAGMFLTMVDNRTRMSRQVAETVAEQYGDKLLRTAVPRTTRLTEMAVKGKPTVIHDRRSAGSRAYFDLMDELNDRFLGVAGVAAADYATGFEPEPDFADMPEPADSAENPEIEDAEPAPAAATGGAAAETARVMDLLRDLGASSARPAVPGNGGLDPADDFPTSALPPAPAIEEPDMVSLDDLLAEEERGSKAGCKFGGDEWDLDDGYGAVN